MAARNRHAACFQKRHDHGADLTRKGFQSADLVREAKSSALAAVYDDRPNSTQFVSRIGTSASSPTPILAMNSAMSALEARPDIAAFESNF
jgi:hypothetical protein